MFFRKFISFALLMTILAGTVTGCTQPKKDDMQSRNPETIQNSTPGTKTMEDAAKQVLKPVFADEKKKDTLSVQWKPVEYEAKVKTYKINEDLSNIENINQFGVFTPEQRKLIARNGFVAVSSKEEQLFYIYDSNEYMKIPSFVTTDSVLQVYHLFFDYSLRTLEYDKLIALLKQMTENMLKKSITVYNGVKNSSVKAAAFKNIAYFGVAHKALGNEYPLDMPDDAKKLADSEFKLVKEASGIERSNIFPFELDFSQYKPRGHYTRNEEFQKYFKAMMWYGQVPFPVFKSSQDGKKDLNLEQIVQALLITYCMFSEYGGVSDLDSWENIYEPTNFYVGKTDDLTLYDLKNLLVSVYGKEPDIEKLLEPQYTKILLKEAEKLPEPQIQAKWISANIPSGVQFRFMGQRYIPDSDILQNLVEPIIRPVPNGLDVMSVLGSERAYDLLINKYKEGEKWEGYVNAFAKQKSKFSKTSEDTWRSNMYYGWLWTLKGLLKPFGEGYPTFMTNKAWEDKSLSTALASWSEMRHDTILYAKGTAAECGGGEEPPVIKGYVEPNIDVYNRLLWLSSYSRQNLSQKGILPAELKNKMQHFEDLLQFLIKCSVKELKNEELTKEEYYQLLIYGGTIERLSTSFVDGYKGWYEISSETDRNMALVADVHSTAKGCLEVGIGPASQIFVAVPIGGKIYLARGAVFSYYEFMSSKRLTDEEWQKMIKENKQPAQPDWTNTFINGEKEEIPKPKQPYSSGC